MMVECLYETLLSSTSYYLYGAWLCKRHIQNSGYSKKMGVVDLSHGVWLLCKMHKPILPL